MKKQDSPVGEFKWLTVVSPEDRNGTELLLEPNDNPVAKEYQKGLVAQPDDWDLKFNYELVRHIFSQKDQSRQQQEQKVKTLIEKMRPQEPSRQELAPEKRG